MPETNGYRTYQGQHPSDVERSQAVTYNDLIASIENGTTSRAMHSRASSHTSETGVRIKDSSYIDYGSCDSEGGRHSALETTKDFYGNVDTYRFANLTNGYITLQSATKRSGVIKQVDTNRVCIGLPDKESSTYNYGVTYFNYTAKNHKGVPFQCTLTVNGDRSKLKSGIQNYCEPQGFQRKPKMNDAQVVKSIRVLLGLNNDQLHTFSES